MTACRCGGWIISRRIWTSLAGSGPWRWRGSALEDQAWANSARWRIEESVIALQIPTN
jgi:hypothetical protein